MSYRTELLERTKAELTAVAVEYGLEIGKKTKAELVDDIIRFETGVPSEAKIEEKPKVEEKPKDEGPLTLVKFVGKNPNFQVGKFNFQNDNPFLAVPERIADHVFTKWPKLFRPATSREVEEFYS